MYFSENYKQHLGKFQVRFAPPPKKFSTSSLLSQIVFGSQYLRILHFKKGWNFFFTVYSKQTQQKMWINNKGSWTGATLIHFKYRLRESTLYNNVYREDVRFLRNHRYFVNLQHYHNCQHFIKVITISD